MAYSDYNFCGRPLSSRINNSSSTTRSTDCLTECDWEVFVIRRDESSGAFKTEIACCEEALEQK